MLHFHPFIHHLKVGSAAKNIDKEDDNATQVNTKIPKDLRLQNSDDDSCVLLSVDLLINLTDRHESKCLA